MVHLASVPNKLIAFLVQPTFCTLFQILCSYFKSWLKKKSHLASAYFKRKERDTVIELNVYLEAWLNIHWEVKNWQTIKSTTFFFMSASIFIRAFNDGIVSCHTFVILPYSPKEGSLPKVEVKELLIAEDDEGAYGPEEVQSTGLS